MLCIIDRYFKVRLQSDGGGRERRRDEGGGGAEQVWNREGTLTFELDHGR